MIDVIVRAMKKSLAIAFYGGMGNVAKALNISRQAVEQWPQLIPEGSAYKLQVVSGDKLLVDPMEYKLTMVSERRRKAKPLSMAAI